MGDPLFRPVTIPLRVGDEEVLITIHEYYDGENSTPTILRVTGPNGLVTSTYEEMLASLGISNPNKRAADAEPTASKDIPSQSGEASPLPAVENVTEPAGTAAGGDQVPGWDSRAGGTRRRRHVRVGDRDIVIWECEQTANDRYNLPARRWFEAPNGLRTLGYYEMLDKLGGRPKPVLPEDEHRPFSPQKEVESASTAGGDAETGISGIVENAFEVFHTNPVGERNPGGSEGTSTNTVAGTSETPASKKQPRKEREPARFLGAYPWTLDERKPEEISDAELDMQLIWHAEQIRESNPDLYEAALDSVKREEYLARQEEELRLLEEDQIAEDSAPRCQFLKSDGEICGSFAVKGSRFCYFHSRTAEGRKKKPRRRPLSIPVLEDDLAVQMAVTHICRGVAEGSLEPKRASILLYGLQVATVALRRKAGKTAAEKRA
jgi:hypothetical protein